MNPSETALSPDVRQKIAIRNPNHNICNVYSDGGAAMEKKGKNVVFDPELQMLINDLIEKKDEKKF